MTTTPAALLIRALAPAELDDYKALRIGVLADHPQAFTSDAGEERGKDATSYLARLGDGRPEGGHFTLGAWHGALLAGAISCDRERRLKARHIGHIAGLMVRGDCAGRGIGGCLLDAAIAEARRADGLEMLTLSVTSDNLAALRLYERAGFARYARLPHAIKLGQRYHAKDLMVLML